MSLFAELKRRNVFRVGVAYVVTAWLLLQVVDVIVPILDLPDWVSKLILLVIVIGFVPTLIFAWAFELTPEGVKRESEIDRNRSITRQTGRKLNRVTIGILVLIVLIMGAERFWLAERNRMDAGQQVSQAVSQEAKPAKAEHEDSASPPDKSIAVLPFTNRSAGGENAQFFSDGIHDDLLTNLSRIHELKVISRTSVMAYRDTDKNMRQIGEELGVGNLLEGGVQQAGNRVRINVQLINAKTDQHLWAETYDREISTENIFDIQGEIAKAIAAALEATLTRQEEAVIGQAPTENLEAYRAVLLSRQHEQSGSFISLEKAIDYARQAIELDPDYAGAHLALAHALSRAISSGALTEVESGDEALAAIETAMTLQPGHAPAYSALGYFLGSVNRPGADQAFEKAMRLDPNNADTLFAYGYTLQRGGNPEPALSLLLRASELDPLSPVVLFALGRTYDVLEEFEKARSTFSRLREVDPESPLGYAPHSGTYFVEGQLDQALYWLRRALFVDPQDYELGGWMVFLNDSLEDYPAADEWSRWLDGWVTNQPQPMAMQARHHYLTGDFESAVQYSNLALKLKLPNRWDSDAIFMRIKRDEALANGNPEAGIAVFTRQHPGLLEEPPKVTADNLNQAVDFAQLLNMSGRKDTANRILNAVIEFYEQPWSTSGSVRFSLVPAKAEALAIMGDDNAALKELRRIIDKGWRTYWRWETALNFNFNSILENPEFQAMIQELAADMEEQRARTQAMADRGEILPPPPVEAG